jgi:hypothetical protein
MASSAFGITISIIGNGLASRCINGLIDLSASSNHWLISFIGLIGPINFIGLFGIIGRFFASSALPTSSVHWPHPLFGSSALSASQTHWLIIGLAIFPQP